MRERSFYWQNIGMSAACFLENRRFLIKYRHESIDFFVKNRKKGYVINFLAYKMCSFDRIDVFDGFFIKKNEMRAFCLWGNGHFLHNICIMKSVFLEKRCFLTKYVDGSSVFLWKSEDKGILLTFAAYKIVKFYQDWHFLTNLNPTLTFSFITFQCFLLGTYGIFSGHNVILCSCRATLNYLCEICTKS